jgi:hypothetical protein
MPRTKAVKATPAASVSSDIRLYGAMTAGEASFWFTCEALGLPAMLPQQRLVPGRQYRTDWCIPQYGIAIEIEGGVWTHAEGRYSRHRTGSGFLADISKYNAVSMLGWMLLRASTEMAESGDAALLVQQAVAIRQQWAARTGLSPAISIPERPAPKRAPRKKAS